MALWALMLMRTHVVPGEPQNGRRDVVQALAGLLRCFKVIYFMRGFEQTAPLINTLQKIVFGMRSFALVLGVVLIA